MDEFPHAREFSRSCVRLEVEVVSGDARIASGQTRDVCMKGIFVFSDQRLPVGSRCRIVLRMGDPPSDIHMEADGAVVREEPEGFAVEFAEMDLESFHHLRNLVLYNSSDPERADRELHEHVGLKRP
jgi:hypothetical protein